MKSIFTLEILLASFFTLLTCQENYTDNFNQSSGNVLCYNCSNEAIESCDTLCTGVNCYINLTLPLSTSTIISYGCASEFVNFGCVNDSISDNIICYCTGNFCNYPEIVDFAENNSTTVLYDKEYTSTSSLSFTDYYTSDNPFIIKNISKRSDNETNEDIFEFEDFLQVLGTLFETFNDVPSNNETDYGEILNEDKILQMLSRLDYIFDKRFTMLSQSISNNISLLSNMISEESDNIKYPTKSKTRVSHNFVYEDFENSGSSRSNSFYSSLWKRILKIYFNKSSYKDLKFKDRNYYLYNEKEATIFDIENAVIKFSHEVNAFILESQDKNINYKHTIVKRDYPPENFSLLQSIITFISSFLSSFGEKLGIVTGNVGRELFDGLRVSVQEQLNQTLTAANIAFSTYTEVLFSKIFALLTNYIVQAQSRKKRNLNIKITNGSLLNLGKEYYSFLEIYQKRKKRVSDTLQSSESENAFSPASIEKLNLLAEIFDKIPYYNNTMYDLNDTERLPLSPILEDVLKPVLSIPSDHPLIPSDLGSFETSGSFSVITKNNSQFSNMSLTTLGSKDNSNGTNVNQNLSTIATTNSMTTIELTTTPTIETTQSFVKTNLPSTKMLPTTKLTTTVNDIINSSVVTTMAAYTTTNVMTTTDSLTTAPMDIIKSTTSTTTKPVTKPPEVKTTTASLIITTTTSQGIFSYISQSIKSFFGFGDSSLLTTTMTPLPILEKENLPPNVTINTNNEYMFMNGTIISPSQLEEMLQKLGKTLYPPTTTSSGILTSIITSTVNTAYTFITAFVNEFNTNFNNANNNSIEKVKDVLDSSGAELMVVTSTISSIQNSSSQVSPYNMLTGLLSAIISLGRKKRDLDNDLNIILNNILPSIEKTSIDSSNIKKLEKTFKEILSNEKLFNTFIDYITENVTLSKKEKSQLSKAIFQTVTTFITNSTLGRMVDKTLSEYSRSDLSDEDYGETYVERMGKSMEELGKTFGKIFNSILENILLATNDYNGLSEIEIKEKMHDDGYQLGLKMGFVIKPILVNFNIVMNRIEKRKKRFIECVNDLYCFQEVLGKDF